MDAELGEYAGGAKGHVRLHAVASALTQFLPEDIESFLTRYPLVNISLEERTGKAVVLAVADGSADLGIVASQTPLRGMTAVPYHRDCLMIGVPQGHALSKRKAIRFADALDYPFVGPHADSSLASLMAAGAKACGKAVQQRIQVSSFDAMCRLVETRLGITMLPKAVLAAQLPYCMSTSKGRKKAVTRMNAGLRPVQGVRVRASGMRPLQSLATSETAQQEGASYRGCARTTGDPRRQFDRA